MRYLWVVMIVCAGPATAWEALTGAQIEVALSGQTLVYDAHTLQHFRADGQTDYITERASTGRWAARGDQYCSTWPPSDTWTCYDVEAEGDAIRFISPDGSMSEGRFRE